MKKDNEAKMKEILDELEDEFEEIKENVEEIEEDAAEEAEKEIEEDAAEEVEEEIEEDAVEEVEEEIEEDAAEEVVEEIEEEDAEEVEEEIEEEAAEEVVEEKKANKKSAKKSVENVDSPIKKVGDYLIAKLKKYKYLFVLDFVVFLLLFFLVPTIILEVKPFVWISLFLIFIILPTVAFYLRKLFRKYQVMMGIPFFYLLILCILDTCTIKDLYGITAHGNLDKSPAWIDALLVTFIIVFLQYLGLTVINLVRRPRKRTRK